MGFGPIFIIAFIGVAIVYSLIATFSKVFYKNKSVADLSYYERKVLHNEATFTVRLALFIHNLRACLSFPPVYIIAIIIAIIVKLLI